MQCPICHEPMIETTKNYSNRHYERYITEANCYMHIPYLKIEHIHQVDKQTGEERHSGHVSFNPQWGCRLEEGNTTLAEEILEACRKDYWKSRDGEEERKKRNEEREQANGCV